MAKEKAIVKQPATTANKKAWLGNTKFSFH